MKHTKMIALILAVAMLSVLLIACSDGNNAMKDAAGTYVGQYTKVVGDDDSARDTSEFFQLVLTEDGKGKHSRDGMEFDVTWTLEGEAFTMSETFIGDPIQYTGTLKNGELDIFNGDPENAWTYEYVYKKQ